jgi:hypothetical protein
LCGYSLRGLTGTAADGSATDGGAAVKARCPECGYPFWWGELLRARQWHHPYLFEHHPRRNIRTFIRTVVSGMRPRRFWSSLNAGHDIRPRRLRIYWVVVSLIILISGVGGRYVAAAIAIYRLNQNMLNAPASWVISGSPSSSFLDELRARVEWSDLEGLIGITGVLWPWLSLVVLLIFQASMRRARIRPAHVLRCVVYSGDVFVWSGLVALGFGVARWLLTHDAEPELEVRAQLAALTSLALGAAATWRLAVAYRKYLRFDHAVATAIASGVIVLLFLVTVLSLLSEQFYMLFLS